MTDGLAEALASPTCSVEVAGSLLGLGRSSAYVAAARGDIPTIKIGRLRRVPTAALRRLLALDECCAKRSATEGKSMAA
jgi:excisionase family DNA binding protein